MIENFRNKNYLLKVYWDLFNILFSPPNTGIPQCYLFFFKIPPLNFYVLFEIKKNINFERFTLHSYIKWNYKVGNIILPTKLIYFTEKLNMLKIFRDTFLLWPDNLLSMEKGLDILSPKKTLVILFIFVINFFFARSRIH